MLNKRQMNIINIVAKSGEPVTAQKIADEIQVSLRTVKRDIKLILEENPDLFVAGRNGYDLNRSIDFPILQEIEVPETFLERRKYILKRLLLNEELTIDGLCQSLYIAPLTLQNELGMIRNELKDTGLNLHIRQDRISLSGSDKGKRKLLQEFINDELSSSSFYIESIRNYLPETDIPWLMDLVSEELKKNEYFLDNYALTNYVTHLAILIETDSTGETDEKLMGYVKENPIYEECKAMMEELCLRLNKHYQKQISLAALYDASFLMLTRIARTGYQPDDKGEKLIDQTTRELVRQIIDEVRINYSIDIDKQDFVMLFSFHIKNLLIRLKNRTPIINVQFKEIKNQFPMLYSISVYVAKKIESFIGIDVSEDEIAFITLHIGTVIEQEQQMKRRLNCILYAPNYYSLGEKLQQRLIEKFPDDIYIADIVTDGNRIPEDTNTDLIIATSQLNDFHAVPYVTVTPFFTQNDMINCFNMIEKLKIRKKKGMILSNISLFFKENCFFLNQGFHSREETISYVCGKMHEYGYVDEDYLKGVNERETISSTAFGDVAIPHPLNNDAKSSLIAVVIEKNGIQWGEAKVHIVFMLSVKREDQHYFREIFDFVNLLMENEKAMKRIMQIRNYHEFYDLLKNQ